MCYLFQSWFRSEVVTSDCIIIIDEENISKSHKLFKSGKPIYEALSFVSSFSVEHQSKLWHVDIGEQTERYQNTFNFVRHEIAFELAWLLVLV